ncbi:MAG: VWA domain-containing protein [Thermosynechococcaceae cyanobacterium]
MRQDYTHIALIADRSGSMSASQGEAQAAINTFIKDQANQPGFCTLSLAQFDNEYELVHDFAVIQDVSEYHLEPRGMTALFDAVGLTIASVGSKLAQMSEPERPALVTIVICTDGAENASKEFSQQRIAAMIKEQRETYNWRFIFLGVDIEAEQVAASIEIPVASAVKVSRSKGAAAYQVTSQKIAAARSAVASGMPAAAADIAYDADEKENLS